MIDLACFISSIFHYEIIVDSHALNLFIQLESSGTHFVTTWGMQKESLNATLMMENNVLLLSSKSALTRSLQ